MMTSRICAPNLKSNEEVVEGMAVQNYWQSMFLGERLMAGWWDDEPVVQTSDDEVKATAWLRRTNATGSGAATPATVIALGNFRNESVNVSITLSVPRSVGAAASLSGAETLLNTTAIRWRAVRKEHSLTMQPRTPYYMYCGTFDKPRTALSLVCTAQVAIDSFQVARIYEPGELIPIAAKRGWLLESID